MHSLLWLLFYLVIIILPCYGIKGGLLLQGHFWEALCFFYFVHKQRKAMVLCIAYHKTKQKNDFHMFCRDYRNYNITCF